VGLTASELAVVSRLLDEALDLDMAGRLRWLDNLPEAHRHLAPVLHRLLVQGHHIGEFSPPVSPASPEAAALLVDDAIGPYRLLRVLGSGGMGVVWLAERTDGAFERKLALKRPRLAWAPELSARMRRERDILAALEHPNIARLYDAGVDAQGRPYLALEYIEGRAIDVYCKEEALDVRARLQLFLQLGDAVGYAHARNVVHRDLKPANVLVTDDGSVRLLDFGVAKLLGGEPDGVLSVTQIAGRAFTPDYASPEQLRGDEVTAASDVYALGVLLYELLSGARPYRLNQASDAPLADQLARTDTPLASRSTTDASAKRALQGDLDTILAKALKKDPRERYASVEEFSADLMRCLQCRPVLAKPPTLRYRTRKLLARNKPLAAAAAIAFVAVTVGAAVALREAVRAHEEARSSKIAKEFVMDMGAVGAIFLALGQSEQAETLARSRVDTLGRSNASEADSARAIVDLARAQMHGGRFAEAEASLRRALSLLRSRSAAAEAGVRAMIAWCMLMEFHFEQASQELDLAAPLITEASATTSRANADLLFARAHFVNFRDGIDEAKDLFQRSIEISAAVDGETAPETVEMKRQYGSALLREGSIAAGNTIFERSVADLRDQRGELDVLAATLEVEQLRLLLHQGQRWMQSVDRLEYLTKILHERRQAVGPLVVARASFSLGWAQTLHGDLDRAGQLFKDTYPYLVRTLQDLRATEEVRSVYADWLMARGNHREAAQIVEQLHAEREQRFGPDMEMTRYPALYAAKSYIMEGDLAAAESALRSAFTPRPDPRLPKNFKAGDPFTSQILQSGTTRKPQVRRSGLSSGATVVRLYPG